MHAPQVIVSTPSLRSSPSLARRMMMNVAIFCQLSVRTKFRRGYQNAPGVRLVAPPPSNQLREFATFSNSSSLLVWLCVTSGKNHFSEMKVDVGMSLREEEEKQ